MRGGGGGAGFLACAIIERGERERERERDQRVTWLRLYIQTYMIILGARQARMQFLDSGCFEPRIHLTRVAPTRRYTQRTSCISRK